MSGRDESACPSGAGDTSLSDRRYDVIGSRRVPVRLVRIIAAAALVGWLWIMVGSAPALWWAGAFASVEAFRIMVFRIGFGPKRPVTMGMSARLRNTLAFLSTGLGGVLWGTAAAVYMPGAELGTTVFFITLMVVVLGVAMIGTASVFAVAAAFVGPALLLPAISFLWAGGPDNIMLAVLAMGALVVFLWGSLQIERLTLEAFRAEQEKIQNEVEAATQKYRAERYKDLLDNVLDGSASAVVVVDKDLRLVIWNERFAHQCDAIDIRLEKGLPYERVIRRMSLAGDRPDDRAEQFVTRLMERLGAARDGAVIRDEYTHFDGRTFEVHGRCTTERSWVLNITNVSDKRQATTDALVHMSHHDGLTGLPNRAKLRRNLARALVHARGSDQSVGLMIIDLNEFKAINDTLGYDMGDALLVDVARTLNAVIPDVAQVSRFAADEFAVILPHERDADMDAAGRSILAAIRNPRQIKGQTVRVAASVGTSSFPRDGGEPEQLLRAASVALQHAKREGRDSIVHYESTMFIEAEARARLEHDILHSLDHDHFSLYYQPQVDLATNELVGAEALLRWNHPQRGWISPANFVAVAELSKLIIPLTEKLLDNACRQAVQWTREGLPDFKTAFNLSPFHLRDGGVYEFVQRVLSETGLPSDRLELELTESAMASDSATVINTLSRLDALGVTLAIDDFGTGYSSMSYLRQLPVDKVKIDRSFVAELTTDEGAAAIVETVIRLAHTLGLKVTAEGIETPEQLASLRRLGCDYGQGYFFARPMPATALARWCRKWSRESTKDRPRVISAEFGRRTD